METEKEINQIKKELENHRERISELEKLIKTKKPEILKKPENGIKRLAQKVNVSEKKIKEIFNFEDETLTLVKVIGANPKEKTKNVSLLVFLGYKYCFNKNEVLSQEIRRNVGENGIPLENFATYLNELIPSLVRKKGKPKSSKTTYRLTVFGESKARELIKKIM
jgi:hypothetical protein